MKKKLYHTTGVDTFTLAVKKDFIALKDEINKLDINKLVNVPTTLINLKTNTQDIDIGKLKTIPVDLKKKIMQQIMKLLKTQNSTH